MKNLIKSKLREAVAINEWDPFMKMPSQYKQGNREKLEQDVMSAMENIIEKYKHDFVDSYGVIDAIYEILDTNFQKISR